jgi:hypothetical protein
MEKADQLLEVHFTDSEIRCITRCADVEGLTPGAWTRRVVTYVAQRCARVRGESEYEG